MADVPNQLELEVGEQRTIELPGLGTAGYVWEHDVVGDDDVIDVRWSRGFPPDLQPQAVGISAPEAVTISARRAGSVEVRLYQHRRWEPPERVHAEHDLSVVVRSSE